MGLRVRSHDIVWIDVKGQTARGQPERGEMAFGIVERRLEVAEGGDQLG